MTWTNGLRTTHPSGVGRGLLGAVLTPARTGQVGIAVDEGAHRVGLALGKCAGVVRAHRGGEFA